MNKKYDIIIIGGGIGGLMCAHRLREKNPGASVIILEKGKALAERSCPILEHKTNKCIKCSHCAIMEGMAGAGAFSDGKFVISTEYGGWLTDFMNPASVIDYIEQADTILCGYGAPIERYMPDNNLKRLALRHDLHMLQAQIKHFGTDGNYRIMLNMIHDLSKNVQILTEADVTDIDKNSHTVTYNIRGETNTLTADYIVSAVGRSGSRFFSGWCRSNSIPLENNQVDIGVRVELPAIIWDSFSKRIYEPKILYRSHTYGDTTRMFCFNDRGSVVTENTEGILTVNGHSYRDELMKTENSNFALLTTIKFTEPFNNPIEYARHVASLSNLISGGSVLVQRLGDLKLGRRTDTRRLAASTVRPSMNAVPGDLSLCMPKRQLDSIIETLDALDKIAPGTANYDTLLYGIECKYYSARPKTDMFELDGCKNIFAVGDGAGYTRSLSQASANGLYVADIISKRRNG